MSDSLPDPSEVPMDTPEARTAAIAMTLQVVVHICTELEGRISAIEQKLGIERPDMPEVTL